MNLLPKTLFVVVASLIIVRDPIRKVVNKSQCLIFFFHAKMFLHQRPGNACAHIGKTLLDHIESLRRFIVHSKTMFEYCD